MGPTGEAGPGTGEPPDSREESVAERADRNLGELLQELRVAGLAAGLISAFVAVMFGLLWFSRGPPISSTGSQDRNPMASPMVTA